MSRSPNNIWIRSTGWQYFTCLEFEDIIARPVKQARVLAVPNAPYIQVPLASLFLALEEI